jgi:predicted neutral ceramidase superfamily lipid hydrolase
MDLAKVDRDVAHVAYFYKCFKLYVARVLKKYFRNLLQQVFYVDVAYLFTYMLQVFYLNAAYVSHICYNCIFKCFIYVPIYVAFMLQVFHGAGCVMGAQPRHRGMRAR